MDRITKAATRLAQMTEGFDFDDLVENYKWVLAIEREMLIDELCAAYDQSEIDG